MRTAGGCSGRAVSPVGGVPAEHAINPALGLPLYATFLAVPFARIGQALRDWQFLVTVFVVNFFCVPLVVWVLARPFTGNAERALLVGMLFILLAPCVDYMIVFTGLVESIDMGPFVSAFVWLIVAPLVAAAITQWARWRLLSDIFADLMVPLMMVVLAVVVEAVAGRTGYAEVSSFCRAFKSHCGVPTGEYLRGYAMNAAV